MRIIYVTSTLPHGPGEPFVIPEILELMRRGHEVLVVPMNPRGGLLHEDAQLLSQITVSRPVLSWDVLAGAMASLFRRPITCTRLAGCMLRSRNARILIKNLVVFPKGLWLGRLARKWNADHIHAHWASCTATMAFAASSVSGVPWSLTAHRWDIDENNLLGLKARRASFVRAINCQGAELIRKLAGMNGFQPVLIHVGVALTSAIILPRARSNGDCCRILTAANLVSKKGHHYLVNAVHLLSQRGIEVALDLAGDGPLRSDLEALVSQLGLESRTRFLGQLSHGELLERMSAQEWDFVVLPSIITASGEYEGIPVTLIEAMSCGLPVISTTTGGIPELLEGGAGVLVNEKDSGALADAIERLANDPNLVAELQAAGRKRVEEEYAVETVVSELENRFASSTSR